MATSRSSIPRDVVPYSPLDPLTFLVKSRSEPEPHLVSFQELHEPAVRMGWCTCDHFYFRVGPDNRDYGYTLRCHHIQRAIEYMCAHLDLWGVTYETIAQEAEADPIPEPHFPTPGLALLAMSFSRGREAGALNDRQSH